MFLNVDIDVRARKCQRKIKDWWLRPPPHTNKSINQQCIRYRIFTHHITHTHTQNISPIPTPYSWHYVCMMPTFSEISNIFPIDICRFPADVFGALYGIMSTVSGAFNFLQYALFVWFDAYPGAIQHVRDFRCCHYYTETHPRKRG